MPKMGVRVCLPVVPPSLSRTHSTVSTVSTKGNTKEHWDCHLERKELYYYLKVRENVNEWIVLERLLMRNEWAESVLFNFL